MTFRRGFKSQCERRAVEYRKQLGLHKAAPLSAEVLAKHLSVTVWSTKDIAALSANDMPVLNDEHDDSWSALTMRIGASNLVLFKPVTSTGRRNSVVMHELSHIILGHELAEACILEDGSLVPGNFNQDQEDEADWLTGTLLLPRPALIAIQSHGGANQRACDQYQVSLEMLTWRTRMTGLTYQMNRRRG
ncbi:ImmA/IrrE family metallo-endopeptidase [Pseudorhodobacter sp.]|uniref:ImmA/IrrE family metallo-endopeptidase n=1 Tax=Pseudorhodobacter sp. TaxID=1934400 RepID=UPI00264A07F4|nr:ImmA/IrrE family metallo-endopeptidase [Pseudorhodobacter sp.]MDN5786530.1 ImmA/IrrE family metallo-endopeptidase [Pseudorhodobacter sp.]